MGREKTLAKRRWGVIRLGGLVALLGALATIAPQVSAEVYSYRDRRGVTHFTNAPSDARFRPVAPTELPVERSPFSPAERRSAFSGARSTFLAARRAYGSLFSPQSEASPALARMIDEVSLRYGVDTALVHAMVRAESGFDPLAVSSKGAQGLMQLMPTTATEIGVRDSFHPRDNLEGGVYYLSELLDRFSGNTRLALAAYNAGPGAVDVHGGVPPYHETRQYLSRVFQYRDEYLRRQIAALQAEADGQAP